MTRYELQMLSDWLEELGMLGFPKKPFDAQKALTMSRKIREQISRKSA